ncbi:hypothetical protein [Microbulbifer yueqingensis]|uniref:hypothetical protein n=1 Tax=Microbulbifer yueqingensis TaxID=658219 RepID=UPI00111402A3|nr:hypothetical protein [Microbulbifer yueqingensis]
MLFRVLLILLSTVSWGGCKAAEVHHFVHEETESDRKNLQWSKSDPKLGSELTVNELPYFVVDFHRFWPGYSATAYLYVIQRDKDPLRLESIEVKSEETGEVREVAIDINTSPKKLENGLHLFRYRILDAGSSGQFSEARSLQVRLNWIDRAEAKRSTEFELEKKVKSEVAWPT